MPSGIEIKILQKQIFDTGSGTRELQKSIQDIDTYYIAEDFIVAENMERKLGRRLNTPAINHRLTESLGAPYVSIAIRGDNRCSLRSLMSSTLIAMRRAIYEGSRAKAEELAQRLMVFADRLDDLRSTDDPLIADLIQYFTPEMLNQFRQLLADILSERVGISDLVMQANCDYSREVVQEADPFNLALSALGAFIVTEGLPQIAEYWFNEKIFSRDEYTPEQAIEFMHSAEPLGVRRPLGEETTSSGERQAFSRMLNLTTETYILRVGITAEGIVSHTDSAYPKSELPEEPGSLGVARIFNTDGHITIALNSRDIEYIRAEKRVTLNTSYSPEPTEISDRPSSSVQLQLSEISPRAGNLFLLLKQEELLGVTEEELVGDLGATNQRERELLIDGDSITSLIRQKPELRQLNQRLDRLLGIENLTPPRQPQAPTQSQLPEISLLVMNLVLLLKQEELLGVTEEELVEDLATTNQMERELLIEGDSIERLIRQKPELRQLNQQLDRLLGIMPVPNYSETLAPSRQSQASASISPEPPNLRSASNTIQEDHQKPALMGEAAWNLFRLLQRLHHQEDVLSLFSLIEEEFYLTSAQERHLQINGQSIANLINQHSSNLPWYTRQLKELDFAAGEKGSLLYIIDKIIFDIQLLQNRGGTWLWSTQRQDTKIENLEQIRVRLLEDTTPTIQNYIENLRTICAPPRNTWYFWQNSCELETYLQEFQQNCASHNNNY